MRAAFAALIMMTWGASGASATEFFFEDFNSYTEDPDVTAAGWTLTTQNDPPGGDRSDAQGRPIMTWTIANTRPATNPPTANGSATTGKFIINENDNYNTACDMDSGMAYDLISPSFDCSGSDTVWLHAACTAQMNNNGTKVFFVDVSSDGGTTWNNAFMRVAPNRGVEAAATTYLPDNTNTDGFFGQLSVDLSPWAANQTDVRLRFRELEHHHDWYIALDDILVNDVPVRTGEDAVLFEWDFTGGSFGDMTIDGLQAGVETWNTEDPNFRYFLNVVSGTGVNRIQHHTGEDFPDFAILENDLGDNWPRDEYMMTPVIDCSNYQEVFLEFDSEYQAADEIEAAQVLVSTDGGTTFSPAALFDYAGGGGFNDTEDPYFAHRILKADQAAGQANVVFAWRFASNSDDGFWAVDDIKVTANESALGPVDSDGDGLFNDQENAAGTDPNDPDSDDDGWLDGEEVNTYGTNPNSADSDEDGIEDPKEGALYGTDPNKADTDGDGLADGNELTTHGTLPTEADTDFDGFDDGDEVAQGKEPSNMLNYPGSMADYCFYEGFDGYLTDDAVKAAGWQLTTYNDPPGGGRQSVFGDPIETWTIFNTRPATNPPSVDGSASTGRALISENDNYGGATTMDSGMAYAAITPSFSCAERNRVWLHVDVLCQLNDNGTKVFLIDVSNDGGLTWNNIFTRVAPNRGSDNDPPATTLLPDNSNLDGYFGRLDLDITEYAAGESDVMIRFQDYEHDEDWYINIDNVLVDGNPVASGTDVVFSEDFSSAGKTGSMIVTGQQTGDNTWTTNDPKGRYNLGEFSSRGVNRLNHATGETAPDFAICDNEIDGALYPRDEYLATPVLDCSNYAEVVVSYKSEYLAHNDVDAAQLLVSLDGGSTFESPIFDYKNGGGQHRRQEPFFAERVFFVPQAAGESNVVFAWRFYSDEGNEGFWAVDDILVTGNTTATSLIDTDADGLTDTEEEVQGTDALTPDSDGDNHTDGEEVAAGTDPLDDSDFPGGSGPSGDLPVSAALVALSLAAVAARAVRKPTA